MSYYFEDCCSSWLPNLYLISFLNLHYSDIQSFFYYSLTSHISENNEELFSIICTADKRKNCHEIHPNERPNSHNVIFKSEHISGP